MKIRRRVRFVLNRRGAAEFDPRGGRRRRKCQGRRDRRRVRRHHLTGGDGRRRRHRLMAASLGLAAVVDRRTLRARLVHRLAARHPGVIGLRVTGASGDARHTQRDDDCNSNEGPEERPHSLWILRLASVLVKQE